MAHPGKIASVMFDMFLLHMPITFQKWTEDLKKVGLFLSIFFFSTGRTGRVCDGLCIRVMTKVFFYQVREFDEAQMKKAPLDKLFLRVKQVGEL